MTLANGCYQDLKMLTNTFSVRKNYATKVSYIARGSLWCGIMEYLKVMQLPWEYFKGKFYEKFSF